MSKINSAISPCPNDTFTFYGIINALVDWPNQLKKFNFFDINELNQNLINSSHGLLKVSFAAYLKNKKNYTLLDSGAAMGFGCGPLLLIRNGESIKDGLRLGIPGLDTTAYLLFKRYFSKQYPNLEIIPMLFSSLEKALINQDIDLALIIHETRFSYDKEKLSCLADLGKLWEEEMDLPIPLGGIVLHNSLLSLKNPIELAIQKSIRLANHNRTASLSFAKKHAQDMQEQVMKAHIDMFVNDYSLSIGKKGLLAIDSLLSV